MTPVIEAVRKLAHLGYRFRLDGNTIKASYEGPGDPDPGQVQPLLETVKANKPEALYFIKSFCPRCGGCCFVPDSRGGACAYPAIGACWWNCTRI